MERLLIFPLEFERLLIFPMFECKFDDDVFITFEFVLEPSFCAFKCDENALFGVGGCTKNIWVYSAGDKTFGNGDKPLLLLLLLLFWLVLFLLTFASAFGERTIFCFCFWPFWGRLSTLLLVFKVVLLLIVVLCCCCCCCCCFAFWFWIIFIFVKTYNLTRKIVKLLLNYLFQIFKN